MFYLILQFFFQISSILKKKTFKLIKFHSVEVNSIVREPSKVAPKEGAPGEWWRVPGKKRPRGSAGRDHKREVVLSGHAKAREKPVVA